MIVSHDKRFIFFPDPLGAGSQVARALLPWADDATFVPTHDPDSGFFTPTEAEWSFDAAGHAFRSYLRIGVVEHPFSRLVRLYDRITQEDMIWKLRAAAGLPRPQMTAWLTGIRPNGRGAAGRRRARWRQFGAWSAKDWMAGRVDHPIRLEHLDEDLTPALSQLGIAPSLGHDNYRAPENWQDRFDAEATRIMVRRYGWDLEQYDYAIPRRVAA